METITTNNNLKKPPIDTCLNLTTITQVKPVSRVGSPKNITSMMTGSFTMNSTKIND